jgi:hypothetical protein
MTPIRVGSILDRSHSVAKPGFSRWMVPLAALYIHLCIGQAIILSMYGGGFATVPGTSARSMGS